MLERICEVSQMVKGFEGAHHLLADMLPVKMTMRQVYEQALRVGADLVNRREDEVNRMLRGEIPAGPARTVDVLVMSPDGGRMQNRARAVGDRWCEYKAAVLYEVVREASAREGQRVDPQPQSHWQFRVSENGYRRFERGEKRYRDPEPQTKTMTATTKTIERFPDYVELEARKRGLSEAHTVAVVGDGSDWIWRVAREVTEARRGRGGRVFEILDIIHASEHLCEAAKTAYGVTKDGARWLNARLDELWRSERDALVAALEQKAAEFGPRPERGTKGADECGDKNDPVRTLWNTRDYFDGHRERIRYDVFRKHGLPLTSAHIESGIKQVNYRVKGSEKQWFLARAEEMLALRCQALSQDGRWDSYFDALKTGQSRLPTQGRIRSARAPSPETNEDARKAA